MIVMASHGRGAFDRWRFGSVAGRVARTATIPVMIVRENSEFAAAELPRLKRLVLAHDGSVLADRAVPVAISLGRRLRLPVRVVRSIDPAGVSGGAAYDLPFSDSVLAQLEEHVRADAGASTTEVVHVLQTAGVDATGDVIAGPAGPALLDYAQPGDLLIVTSHGRGGVRRWLLGSVAEKLVRLAKVPVVLVPSRDSADPATDNREMLDVQLRRSS